MERTELILLDQFDFHHRIAETKGPALVIFTAPGCSACRAWKRLLRDSVTHFAQMPVFEVDVERDLALAREFDVFHLPALFLFHDGAFHGEIRCRAAVEAVLTEIRSLLRQAPQELP